MNSPQEWVSLPEYLNQRGQQPTISNIGLYYEKHRDKIIQYGKTRPLQYFWSYPFDWYQILTPIEWDAWQIIRTLGHVILYPQYNVLNFRPDFANPTKKIILECDGKDYHDVNRDTKRDEKLLAAGWHVFRVTGSELKRQSELKWDDYEDQYEYSSLERHFMHTAEGVIKAIKTIYFTGKYDDGPATYPWLYRTLEAHRLVDFELPYLIDPR